MPAIATLVSPAPARPDTPIPEKIVELTDVQPKKRFSPTRPRRRPDPLFPPSSPYAAILPIQLNIDPDTDTDTEPSMSENEEDEDEYTLSAYGDISLSRVIISPLQSPTSPSPNTSPLQSRFPHPNLRLRVRRPPMPKRRMSHAYVPDPLPLTGGLDPEDRWPGSPRPIRKNQRWHQHQPILPPLSIAPPSSWVPEERVSVKNSPVGKPANEPSPESSTIRPSTSDSSATQPVNLPQEARKQKDDVQKSPLSSPVPKPPQNEPKPTPWRTRLPARLPIPKWGV